MTEGAFLRENLKKSAEQSHQRVPYRFVQTSGQASRAGPSTVPLAASYNSPAGHTAAAKPSYQPTARYSAPPAVRPAFQDSPRPAVPAAAPPTSQPAARPAILNPPPVHNAVQSTAKLVNSARPIRPSGDHLGSQIAARPAAQQASQPAVRPLNFDGPVARFMLGDAVKPSTPTPRPTQHASQTTAKPSAPPSAKNPPQPAASPAAPATHQHASQCATQAAAQPAARPSVPAPAPAPAHPISQAALRPASHPVAQSASRPYPASAAPPPSTQAPWKPPPQPETQRPPSSTGKPQGKGSGHQAYQAAQSARPSHRGPPSQAQSKQNHPEGSVSPYRGRPSVANDIAEAWEPGARLGSLPKQRPAPITFTEPPDPPERPRPAPITFTAPTGSQDRPIPAPMTCTEPDDTHDRPRPAPITFPEFNPTVTPQATAHVQHSTHIKPVHTQAPKSHPQSSSVPKSQGERCSTRVPIPGAAAAGSKGTARRSTSTATQGDQDHAARASAGAEAPATVARVATGAATATVVAAPSAAAQAAAAAAAAPPPPPPPDNPAVATSAHAHAAATTPPPPPLPPAPASPAVPPPPPPPPAVATTAATSAAAVTALSNAARAVAAAAAAPPLPPPTETSAVANSANTAPPPLPPPPPASAAQAAAAAAHPSPQPASPAPATAPPPPPPAPSAVATAAVSVAASDAERGYPRDPRVQTAPKQTSMAIKKHTEACKSYVSSKTKAPARMETCEEPESACEPSFSSGTAAAAASDAAEAATAAESAACQTASAAAAAFEAAEEARTEARSSVLLSAAASAAAASAAAASAAAASAAAVTASDAEPDPSQQPTPDPSAEDPQADTTEASAALSNSLPASAPARLKAEPLVHERVSAPNYRAIMALKLEPRQHMHASKAQCAGAEDSPAGDGTHVECDDPMPAIEGADVATGGDTNVAKGNVDEASRQDNNASPSADTGNCSSDLIGSLMRELTADLQTEEAVAPSESSGRTVSHSAAPQAENDGEADTESPRETVGYTSCNAQLAQQSASQERYCNARRAGHVDEQENAGLHGGPTDAGEVTTDTLQRYVDQQEKTKRSTGSACARAGGSKSKQPQQQKLQVKRKKQQAQKGSNADQDEEAACMAARGWAPDGGKELSCSPDGTRTADRNTQKDTLAPLAPVAPRMSPACAFNTPKSLTGKRSGAQSSACEAREPNSSTAERSEALKAALAAETPKTAVHERATRDEEAQVQALADAVVPAVRTKSLAADGPVYMWPSVPFRGNPCATLRRIWSRMAVSEGDNAVFYDRFIRQEDAQGRGTLLLEDSLGKLHRAAKETSTRKYTLFPDSKLHKMIPISTCRLTKTLYDWLQPVLFPTSSRQEPLRSHSGSRFTDYRVKDKQVHHPEKELLFQDESGDEQLAGIGVHHFMSKLGVNEVVYSVSRDITPRQDELEYERKHVAAWMSQFLGQPVGKALPPIELEGHPQLRTSRSVDACEPFVEGREEAEQTDALEYQDADDQDTECAVDGRTGLTYCDYEDEEVQEKNESVHRFYILDSSGSRHLAAEGRKPKKSEQSTQFIYSPHPQFIEVLPMRSGSSLDVIEGWIQRIISTSSCKNSKGKSSNSTKRNSTKLAVSVNDISEAEVREPDPEYDPISDPISDPVSEQGTEELRGDMKTCGICTTRKYLSQFAKDKKRPDGISYICRICRRISKKYTVKVLREAVKNGKYYSLVGTFDWPQDVSLPAGVTDATPVATAAAAADTTTADKTETDTAALNASNPRSKAHSNANRTLEGADANILNPAPKNTDNSNNVNDDNEANETSEVRGRDEPDVSAALRALWKNGSSSMCSLCGMQLRDFLHKNMAKKGGDPKRRYCSRCNSLRLIYSTSVLRKALENGSFDRLKGPQVVAAGPKGLLPTKNNLPQASASAGKAPATAKHPEASDLPLQGTSSEVNRVSSEIPVDNRLRDSSGRYESARKRAPKRANSTTRIHDMHASSDDETLENESDDDFVLHPASETRGKPAPKPQKRQKLGRQGLCAPTKPHESDIPVASTTSASGELSDGGEAERNVVRRKRKLAECSAEPSKEASREVQPPAQMQIKFPKTMPRTARLRDTHNNAVAAAAAAAGTAAATKTTTPPPRRRTSPPPASAMALRTRKPRQSFPYFVQDDSWVVDDQAAMLRRFESARSEQAEMLVALARKNSNKSAPVGVQQAAETAGTSNSDAAPAKCTPAGAAAAAAAADAAATTSGYTEEACDAADGVRHGAGGGGGGSAVHEGDVLQDGSSAPPPVATPAANRGTEQPETPVATPSTAAATGFAVDANDAKSNEPGGGTGANPSDQCTQIHDNSATPKPSDAVVVNEGASGAAAAVGGGGGYGSGSGAVHKQFVLGYLNALAFCGRMGDDPDIAAAMATMNQAAVERLHGAGPQPS